MNDDDDGECENGEKPQSSFRCPDRDNKPRPVQIGDALIQGISEMAHAMIEMGRLKSASQAPNSGRVDLLLEKLLESNAAAQNQRKEVILAIRQAIRSVEKLEQNWLSWNKIPPQKSAMYSLTESLLTTDEARSVYGVQRQRCANVLTTPWVDSVLDRNIVFRIDRQIM